MISAETYLAFASIATLVVVAPGPATFLLLKNTPAQGRTAGLLNTAGIVTAVLTHAMLSMMGLSAIVLASPTAFQVVKVLAAGYLFYLGFLACRDAWNGLNYANRLDQTADNQPYTAWGSFTEGWLMNMLNPKPSMFYLSIFPQFLDPSGHVFAQGGVLALIHASISAAWFSFVVFGIDQVKMLLRRQWIWRALRAVTGIVLIGFAFRLITLRAMG